MVRVEINGSPIDDTPEVLRVAIKEPIVSVALRPPLICHEFSPFNETRLEFGRRLRRGAAEIGHYLERQIVAELRRMGHLVP